MKGERGENYRAWEIGPLTCDEAQDFDLVVRSMIGYAILAPSTHNTQPWLFAVDSSRKAIRVMVDEDAILPESDRNKRQAFISVGCVLANCEVAAGYYGYSSEINYFIDEDDPCLVGEIILGESSVEVDEGLFRAMATRRVNRSECELRPIPDEVLVEMKEVVDEEIGLELRLIGDGVTKNIIGGIQEMADRKVFTDKRFRDELADWLLPNNTEKFVGMPGNTFGLDDEEAREIHEQLKGGRIDYDLASGVAIGDRDRIRTANFVGVICSSEDKPVDWVRAGRAFQRMALVLEKHGVSMAVSAAIVEVPVFKQTLKARLMTGKKPVMIFTVGYATEERPHSPRKRVEDVIIK